MLGISPSQDPSGGRYRQLSPVLLRRPAAVSPTSSSLETQLSPFTGKHVKTQPGTRPWPPAVCRHLDEVYPDLVQEYHRVQLSFPSQYDNLPLLSRFGAFPCPRPGTKPPETPPVLTNTFSGLKTSAFTSLAVSLWLLGCLLELSW